MWNNHNTQIICTSWIYHRSVCNYTVVVSTMFTEWSLPQLFCHAIFANKFKCPNWRRLSNRYWRATLTFESQIARVKHKFQGNYLRVFISTACANICNAISLLLDSVRIKYKHEWWPCRPMHSTDTWLPLITRYNCNEDQTLLWFIPFSPISTESKSTAWK